MSRLWDRNANIMAHDYAAPPYNMSAVYVVNWTSPTGTHVKVGVGERQSKDVTEILLNVRQRVYSAVPFVGPHRNPVRPTTFVWVVLALIPSARHELEQALVERFGRPQFDPNQQRRREFCDEESFSEISATIDTWRESLPDVFSESLSSEDAGSTYVVPNQLLPYSGQTEGLWVETTGQEVAVITLSRKQLVPTWAPTSVPPSTVTGREDRVRELLARHGPGRVDRLLKDLRKSPAITSAVGAAYKATLIPISGQDETND